MTEDYKQEDMLEEQTQESVDKQEDTEQVLTGAELEKYLLGLIQEGIDQLLIKSSASEMISTIIEVGNKKTGIDKADLRDMINAGFKKIYNPEKYQEMKYRKLGTFEVVDRFKGK